MQGAALSVEDLNKDLKQGSGFMGYRGTSLKRNNLPLGPNSRPISRALWWSWGGGSFVSARYPCANEPADRALGLRAEVAGGWAKRSRFQASETKGPEPSAESFEPIYLEPYSKPGCWAQGFRFRAGLRI